MAVSSNSLGVSGYSFADLHDPERLSSLYERFCEQVAADVRDHFGDKVYDTVIPRNIRISEAPSHGLPVLVYDQRCAGAQA